jgi:uncharacterized protein (DUF342 family)
MLDALSAQGVVFGIKESSIEKLAMRPIFNLKIEVARGLNPIDGEDGRVIYHVKKDSEYKPIIQDEGIIDYKNIDYFQMVEKGQLLCEIIKETEGIEGCNIFGADVPAKAGRPPEDPKGKNTEYIEDGAKLIASCDGVVRFITSTIEINDTMYINSSVNQQTGNIDFSGDVIVGGDVCEGFTVCSGGNIIVKGVVEAAHIEAAGNVHISNGVNGAGKEGIFVGGDLRCKYIENANLHVEGNISADYIIDSKIVCNGNIELRGSRELVVGGEIKLLGQLEARDIGTENERVTRIEILGVRNIDTVGINKFNEETEVLQEKAKALMETATKCADKLKSGRNPQLLEFLDKTMKQILSLKERMDYNMNQVERLENNWTMDYFGEVICKRKIYQGVKINFGDTRFRFNLDNIEHCRIYWHKGEIQQATL